MITATVSHLEEIEYLLAEPVASALHREQAAFGDSLRASDGTVVLFGAGRLGQLCARALHRAGVPLRAFCDGNHGLHGSTVDGVEVISPAEAAGRFGSALFVVAIWTGTARESMLDRIAFLQRLGCAQVRPYASLLWAHGGQEMPFHSFDLPSRTLASAAQLREIAACLGDVESVRVFLAALRQRVLGVFDAVTPAADQYFPENLLQLGSDETFVDGGAFDGDTLVDFLRRVGGDFNRYHAFEPDGANSVRLFHRIAGLDPHVRAKVIQYAVALYSETTTLSFSDQGSPTSSLQTAGSVKVRAERLDDILGDAEVSLLKLDIEGAELAALCGAARTLLKRRPKVAACVYHRPSDLWTIPLQIRQNLPESCLYLRQHGWDGWETVCYVIPNERATSLSCDQTLL